MGQINTNNYPAVDSLADADLLIVENATHGTGTTTPKQLRENAIGTDPLQTTAQTVTEAINEIFEMATDTVVGLELGKMTSFSDGVIVTDIDLHRAPVAGDRILFYHSAAVASPSSLTTYNDGVAVTTAISDFSMTHPAGLTLMKCTALGESLRWQTVQDITSGYTAGTGISINGTTISNSAPQLGDDIAYSRIDTVTSGALGYFSADADCLVMDFRTDAEPYNGGYTLRLTTTGASFKYAVLKDKAGNNYAEEIPAGSLVMCKSNVSGTGSEADPVVVTVLEIGNVEMAHDVEVLKDICITEKTATGNPITVTDALPYNAVSVSTEIEPIQDLHGYANPWVGGAGKNLLPMTVSEIKAANIGGTWSGNVYTVNGVTITIDTDEAGNVIGIKTNGTASAVIYFIIAKNLAVSTNVLYLNGCPANGSNETYQLMCYKYNGSTNVSDTGTGSLSFIISDSNALVQIVIRNGTNVSGKTFYPMLRLSTETDASFAPYSNICPISGRTEVAVDDHGKNYCNRNDFTEGYYISEWGDISEWATAMYSGLMPVTSGKSYTFSINATVANSHIRLHAYDASGGWVAQITDIAVNPIGLKTYTYTVPNGVAGVRISCSTTDNNIQFEEGSVATAYEPYKSSSVTIQLGQTVYGGTLNVTTGVLTIDEIRPTFSGAEGESWSISNHRFAVTLTSASVDTPSVLTCLSNKYEPKTASDLWGNRSAANYVGITTQGANAYIVDNVHYTNYDSTDLAAFVADLSINNLQISYKLATPQTIQLTPTMLTMLKGYNRLSSDGDITLTYKADRLAAIEAALAALA